MKVKKTHATALLTVEASIKLVFLSVELRSQTTL